MAKIDTKELFDQASTLGEELEDVMERRRANRDLLRLLRDSGQLSEAEQSTLAEIYPPRERGKSTESDDNEE